MYSLPVPILLLVSTLTTSILATYTLQQDYTGANFYSGFEFFTEPDPTDGHVQFLPVNEANDTAIAGLINGGNASMAVYLGVDSSNVAPNGRNSVRVSSTATYHHGLFIADIVHMPGGVCGTWPSFWMVGPDWPVNGEIDIIEGVNNQQANSMTLHTNAGVVVQNVTGVGGLMQTTNCDINAPGQAANSGCSVMAESGLTFGSAFNQAGGGVYATEWTSSFIKIWFFPRSSIPQDITSGTPNPNGTWGDPDSVFQGDFNMDEHFTNMNIVFDTTFCGAWAGAVWSSSGCASLAPTCEEYVTSQPAAFKDAYWAINTLQVFQDDGASTSGTAKRSVESEHVFDEHPSGHEKRSWHRGGSVIPSNSL